MYLLKLFEPLAWLFRSPPSETANPYDSPNVRRAHDALVIGIDVSYSVASVAQAMAQGYGELRRKLTENPRKIGVTLYSVAGEVRLLTTHVAPKDLPVYRFVDFANARESGGMLEGRTSICRFLREAVDKAIELQDKKAGNPAIFLVTDGQPSDATIETCEALRPQLKLAKERGIAIYINCFLYRRLSVFIKLFRKKLHEEDAAIRWEITYVDAPGRDQDVSAVNAFRSVVDNIDRVVEPE